MNPDFNNIRAYEDEDFESVIPVLTENKEFTAYLAKLSEMIFHSQDTMLDRLKKCRSIDEMDSQLIIPFLKFVVSVSATSLDISGKENISHSALYLSNHRDIVLDASLLTMLIRLHNNERIYMGMGTNLFVTSWIEPLVRLAKCYSVIRGGTPKEMLYNSSKLSAYMHYIIAEQHQSMWLAQREGRAKDSNDLTQPALLKMLLLSSRGDSLLDQITELNITPVAISYEYDPCDYLKAQELQIRRDNNNIYQKTPEEDYRSMYEGLTGFKGRINYVVSPSINSELPELYAASPIRNEQIRLTCALIDKHIHQNYHIYNVNRIAYDQLYGKHFANLYSQDEENDFLKYIQTRIDKIEIENKDCDFLRSTLLGMYANPLLNKLKYQ